MATPRKIQTPLTEEIITSLHAGDMVLLSGEVYTARDVAHRRLYDALSKGEALPIYLPGAILFYAAPTPTAIIAIITTSTINGIISSSYLCQFHFRIHLNDN